MFSDLGKRRDKAGDANEPSVGEQFGHLSDTTDVFLAVFGREAQVLVQAVADVVSIQRVARDSMRHKVLLQGKTDGSLPGARQTWWGVTIRISMTQG